MTPAKQHDSRSKEQLPLEGSLGPPLEEITSIIRECHPLRGMASTKNNGFF